jgi:hypothetical protein
MIQRRARAAEITATIGTTRATGVTTYLKNGGTLEKAAQMANHAWNPAHYYLCSKVLIGKPHETWTLSHVACLEIRTMSSFPETLIWHSAHLLLSSKWMTRMDTTQKIAIRPRSKQPR